MASNRINTGIPARHETPEHIARNILVGAIQRNLDLMILLPVAGALEPVHIDDTMPYGAAIGHLEKAVRLGLGMAALEHRVKDDMFRGFKISPRGKWTPITKQQGVTPS